MTSIEIKQRENHIEFLFDIINNFKDNEIKSHWVKYLCVIISGYLEFSIQIIFDIYCEKNANSYVHNFASTKLDRLYNPKTQRIIEVANSFNKNWGDHIKKYTKGELKDSIDGIIENRNKIAHGDDSQITYNQLLRWYINSKKVVDFVGTTCC